MNVQLTKPQSTIYTDLKRFRVVVAGRRFGKSYIAGVELLNAAIGVDKATGEELKKQTVVYIAPTFAMCKQIMWAWLKEHTPPWAVKRMNSSDLMIEFKNGSIIYLKSGENYNSLRGLSISFVVMDEVADLHEDCWSLVVRPALSDQEGGALFIGTPKGNNHFFEKYLRGQSEAMDSRNWASYSYTTAQGGNVSLDEIQEARYDLSPTDFKQEYEASFECLGSRVYPEFGEDNMQSCKDNGDAVYIGLDFNVRRMTAVCASNYKDRLEVFQLLTVSPCNTYKMSKLIQKTFPGRRIIVYPDPSGRATTTKAESGVTDHSILRDHQFQVILPKKQLKITDRLTTVNSLICNAAGHRNLLVDHSCTSLRIALLTHQYDEKTEQPDKKTKDHIDDVNDSLGYLVYGTHPVNKAGEWEDWNY